MTLHITKNGDIQAMEGPVAYNANYFSINFLINYSGRLLQSLVQAYDTNYFSINYAGRILQSLAQGLQRGADRMSLDA
ncbi:hypothetical protein DXG01_009816 [Tephrocybe rancida]|nr:hypothetical protein DXG01_009816 [Tephrocybe rancida]